MTQRHPKLPNVKLGTVEDIRREIIAKHGTATPGKFESYLNRHVRVWGSQDEPEIEGVEVPHRKPGRVINPVELVPGVNCAPESIVEARPRTMAQILDEFCLPLGVRPDALRRLGSTTRRLGANEVRLRAKAVALMREAGFSVKQIGDFFGVSHSVIVELREGAA